MVQAFTIIISKQLVDSCWSSALCYLNCLWLRSSCNIYIYMYYIYIYIGLSPLTLTVTRIQCVYIYNMDFIQKGVPHLLMNRLGNSKWVPETKIPATNTHHINISKDKIYQLDKYHIYYKYSRCPSLNHLKMWNKYKNYPSRLISTPQLRAPALALKSPAPHRRPQPRRSSWA